MKLKETNMNQLDDINKILNDYVKQNKYGINRDRNNIGVPLNQTQLNDKSLIVTGKKPIKGYMIYLLDNEDSTIANVVVTEMENGDFQAFIKDTFGTNYSAIYHGGKPVSNYKKIMNDNILKEKENKMANKNIKQFTESMTFDHPEDPTKEIFVEAGDYYMINDDGTITLLSEEQVERMDEEKVTADQVVKDFKSFYGNKFNIKGMLSDISNTWSEDWKGNTVYIKDDNGNEFTMDKKEYDKLVNVKESTQKVEEAKMYLVKGTANGKKGEIISKSLPKDKAEELKKSLEDQMKIALPKYQWIKDLEVVEESSQKDGSVKMNEEVDVEKVIKDLQGNFGDDNEKQMAGVQLLKGLSTSDEPIANEFMKKLDKATTEISKEVLGDEKVEENITIKEGLTAYKITFEDGSTMSTSMASTVTLKDAEDYYIGQKFNMGVYPKEKMLKAVKVEKLK